MCNPLKTIKKAVGGLFGGGEQAQPVVDNSADIARQQESERQAKILEGQGKIDSVFGQFTPDFYNNITKSYLDYYNPQVDRQYNDAKEKLTYGLARSGNSLSSTGNEQTSRLFDAYNEQKALIANKAADAAAAAKGQVEGQKSDLYGLNSSSADPSLVSSRANASAVNLIAPPAYSPLADVFAGFVNSGANANLIAQNQTAINQQVPAMNFNPKASGKVVNG